MPTFRVTAATKDNDTYNEVVEAPDRFQVYREVRERGDKIVKIREEGKEGTLSLSFITNALHGISLDEKVILSRNLAAMLEAGLTSSRALSVMERQTSNPRLRSVLGSLIADVRKGNTFSSALAKFKDVFSSLMVSMVRAGEESGKLAEALRVVSTQMDRSNTLKKKIRGALIYPAIVLSAMVIIAILMLMYVVPTLTQTFQELGTELPPTTQLVIAVSTFLSTHTLLSIGLIIGAIALMVTGVKTPRGKRIIDTLMIHVPIIRPLVIETNAARTARTLASLLSAGVDVVLSIGIAKDVVENHMYQKVLAEAEASVEKGGTLSATFAAYPKLYPPLMAEMIAVGEETGRMSDLLKETSEFYENEVEQKTKDLSTVVEPFLMIIIGSGVGFFAISMIAPIYSLSNSI